jgi:hypothetical protein
LVRDLLPGSDTVASKRRPEGAGQKLDSGIIRDKDTQLVQSRAFRSAI